MAKRYQHCNDCDRLSKELSEVENELKKARRLLATIADHAGVAVATAAAELGGGGSPRGRWSYLKAQVNSGNAILHLMGLPQVEIEQRRRAMFGKDLFSGFLRGK